MKILSFLDHHPKLINKDFFIFEAINLENDLNDIPGNLIPSVDYQEAVQYNKRKAALQAYLACINNCMIIIQTQWNGQTSPGILNIQKLSKDYPLCLTA